MWVGRDWPLRLLDHHRKKDLEKEQGVSFPCEGYGVTEAVRQKEGCDGGAQPREQRLADF